MHAARSCGVCEDRGMVSWVLEQNWCLILWPISWHAMNCRHQECNERPGRSPAGCATRKPSEHLRLKPQSRSRELCILGAWRVCGNCRVPVLHCNRNSARGCGRLVSAQPGGCCASAPEPSRSWPIFRRCDRDRYQPEAVAQTSTGSSASGSGGSIEHSVPLSPCRRRRRTAACLRLSCPSVSSWDWPTKPADLVTFASGHRPGEVKQVSLVFEHSSPLQLQEPLLHPRLSLHPRISLSPTPAPQLANLPTPLIAIPRQA